MHSTYLLNRKESVGGEGGEGGKPATGGGRVPFLPSLPPCDEWVMKFRKVWAKSVREICIIGKEKKKKLGKVRGRREREREKERGIFQNLVLNYPTLFSTSFICSSVQQQKHHNEQSLNYHHQNLSTLFFLFFFFGEGGPPFFGKFRLQLKTYYHSSPSSSSSSSSCSCSRAFLDFYI